VTGGDGTPGGTTGVRGVGTGPAPQRPALIPPAADVVVVGGGHNGLVAACLLAAAGRSVVVLERSDHLGGAAVSATVFPGVAARVSRYSYLLSLFPRALLTTLGLDLRTVPRRVSSYTPDPTDPRRGLLVPSDDPPALHAALRDLTGSDADAGGWQRFYGHTAALARAVFPSLTEPLPTRAQMRDRVGDAAAWDALVTTPIGDTLDSLFGTGPGAGTGSDLVKGVVATDALIGTSTSLHDPSCWRTAACSTTRSATGPATGTCRSVEWALSRTPSQPAPAPSASGSSPRPPSPPWCPVGRAPRCSSTASTPPTASGGSPRDTCW